MEEVYTKTTCPACQGQRIGELIVKGTPQQIRDNPNSKTGRYLA